MFLTVGHSNLELATFLDMVGHAGATVVVDVRKLAGSRRYPHFNADVLAPALERHGIHYVHIDAFTGRRPRQKDVDPAVNAGWRNQSFHNYADWALGADFTAALTQVEALEDGETPAIMCAEAVWWRCHRRLIADNLLARGHDVAHLMGDARLVPASVTAGGVVRTDGHVVYPPSEADS